MNQSHSHRAQADPNFEVTDSWVAAGCDDRPCATPQCRNLVSDPWEETGTLCASCAIEGDLADRSAQWDRLFSTVH